MGGKTSFAMLSAFESASHSKQVFFHSKHVVALGENHPAASSLFSGVGGGEGHNAAWGKGNPAILDPLQPVSLKKYLT